MLPTLAAQPTQPQHGGSDALGVPQWDFSTNSNATGPCPHTVVALAGADITRYPDPTYTALRHTLAAWHGVDSWRIVLGSSGSELIARLTAWVSAQVRTSDKGCSNNGSGNTAQPAVWLPAYHYADYAHAAALHGMVQVADVGQADLIWLCAPSSPLGQALALPQQWAQRRQSSTVVLDCAYAPLQLTDSPLLPEAFNRHAAWQIFTPNKALGVCGLRAAYAIAPQHLPDDAVQSVAARAASWPLGAYRWLCCITGAAQPRKTGWRNRAKPCKATRQHSCKHCKPWVGNVARAKPAFLWRAQACPQAWIWRKCSRHCAPRASNCATALRLA